MTAAALALEIGTAPTLIACLVAYSHQRPGKRARARRETPQARQMAARWDARGEFARIGVRVKADGFVYGWITSRRHEPLAGATATVEDILPIRRGKVRLQRVRIRFEFGGEDFIKVTSIRDRVPVAAEVARFNRLARSSGRRAGFVATNPALRGR